MSAKNTYRITIKIILNMPEQQVVLLISMDILFAGAESLTELKKIPDNMILRLISSGQAEHV